MHPISRCCVPAVVVLMLVGAAHDGGAQGRGGGSQPQPVTTPAGRFTSTMKFVPAPPDVRPAPFPHSAFIGQRPFPFQRFAFWPWGAWLPVPIYTASVGYAPPPLEGAPVGGIQLDIDPRRAQVYVDGIYAGVVEEFSGYFHHLELPAGQHDIAVVAPGYEPLNLQVIVAPGATLTQRAALARAYGR